MADIATLGLEIRSEQAAKGASDLDKLTNAARRAEAATKGVTTGARGAAAAAVAVSGASGNAAAALSREAAAARQAAQALDMHARAANQNIRGFQRANVGNLAAQFQDIAVSSQMGMGAMQIALQQGTQMAAVLAAMDRPVRGLSEALLQLVTPVSLLTIGIVALVAAGLQMVDWPKAAAWAMERLADTLDAIAPYAVAAATALALIYAPTIITGLVHLIALIARVGVAALAAAGSFATAWLAAMGPVGWLITGMAAIGTAAFLLRDEINNAIGVDVVAIMKDAGNFIINSFEAAYADVKFVWSNFGDMLGAAVIGGVNIAIRAINGLIEKATAGIDRLLDVINPMLEASGMGGIEKLGGSFSLPELPNPYADRFSRANASHAAEIARIMGQDRLGEFGAAIGEGASAASGKLKELAEWMGRVDEKATKKKGGKTEAERYSNIVDGANRRIASLQAEHDALGMTEYAAAKLAYETDLLNEAQRKGITLTAAQRAELSTLAGTMASIEIATQKAREAMDFAKDVTRGFFADFRSGIEQGKRIWESFADAALNALDRIVDKLLDDVLDAIFRVNTAGGSGGGGGLMGFLGSLFGMGGGSSGAWGVVSSGRMTGLFAGGGYTGDGGMMEPAGVVHRGEFVFSAAATRALGAMNLDRLHRQARGYAGGGYVGPAVPRVQAAANGNAPTRSETTVKLIMPKGWRAEIVAEARQGAQADTLRIVEEYDQTALPARVNEIAADPRVR